MLRQGPNTLRRLRQLSDGLCMKHGLSVLTQEQKQTAQGMSTREYRSAERGQSWKFRLMNTIDDCMCYAKTKAEFMTLMKSEGYDIRWTNSRKNITYTTPDGNKCRDSKLHDNKYLKEAMELEFAIRAELISGRIEAAQPHSERSAVRRLGGADEYPLGHQQSAGGAEPAAEPAAAQSMSSQMQTLETSLNRISWLLEQAGKKKEKRVWQWRWHLPDIHLGWGWLLPLPVLTALWAIYYSLATILNALGMVAP